MSTSRFFLCTLILKQGNTVDQSHAAALEFFSHLDQHGYAFTGQVENAPTTDRHHIQFVVKVPGTAIRRTGVATQLDPFSDGGHVHVVDVYKLEGAKAYVNKQETRVSGPYNSSLPLLKPRGPVSSSHSILKLIKAGKSIKDCIEAHPSCYRQFSSLVALHNLYAPPPPVKRPLRVYFIYGKPGVGKTTLAFDRCDSSSLFRMVPGKDSFNGYKSEHYVIQDDISPTHCFERQLDFMDPFVKTQRVLYGQVHPTFSTLFITSNFGPIDLLSRTMNQPNTPGYDPVRASAWFRRVTLYIEVLSFTSFRYTVYDLGSGNFVPTDLRLPPAFVFPTPPTIPVTGAQPLPIDVDTSDDCLSAAPFPLDSTDYSSQDFY